MRDECPHCEGEAPCARTECERAERIAANIRAKGSDARSVRDAVHEACHAIRWGLRGKWTREKIDKKNPYKGRMRAWGVRDEITARAVEALVMQKLGLPYEQDKWVLMMIMETLKLDNIAMPGFDWAKDAIVARMGTREAEVLALDIIDMFDKPVKVPRTRKAKVAA